MSFRDLESLLEGQLATCTLRANRKRGRGEPADASDRFAECLRLTLATVLWYRDLPAHVADGTFTLRLSEWGELEFRNKRKTIPVTDSYLRSFLREAGVRIRANQVILLAGTFARLVVEEALARIGVREVRTRLEKTLLLEASQDAGSIEAFPQVPLQDTESGRSKAA